MALIVSELSLRVKSSLYNRKFWNTYIDFVNGCTSRIKLPVVRIIRNNGHMPLPYAVYLKKCAHGFCFDVICCGYTLTDFPISTRLTSLALWQSNDCPIASKATLINMDKYFTWIHYGRLHNHNKAKHNKTVRIFLGIYCIVHAWKLH